MHAPLVFLLQGNQGVLGNVPLWLTVVILLAAPVAALAGAALATYFNNRGATNRLRIELNSQQQRERQLEERKERLNAYLRLVVAARNLGRMKKIDPDEAGGRDDLSEALAEIQLVLHTKELGKAAQTLFDDCVDARKKTAEAHKRNVSPDSDPVVDEAIKKAEASRQGFLQEARKELKLPKLER